MGAASIVLIVVIAVILIIIFAVVTDYNRLATLKVKIDEAFSTMDVYLKKRHDLIPNLVETVKGYTKHESETLENVVKARNNAISGGGDRLENEKELTGALGRLIALSESYPELKADSQFTKLQGELGNVENDIANARKYYNGVVKQYNQQCVKFPSSIIASMFHFEKGKFFEVGSDAERENVQVKF